MTAHREKGPHVEETPTPREKGGPRELTLESIHMDLTVGRLRKVAEKEKYPLRGLFSAEALRAAGVETVSDLLHNCFVVSENNNEHGLCRHLITPARSKSDEVKGTRQQRGQPRKPGARWVKVIGVGSKNIEVLNELLSLGVGHQIPDYGTMLSEAEFSELIGRPKKYPKS